MRLCVNRPLWGTALRIGVNTAASIRVKRLLSHADHVEIHRLIGQYGVPPRAGRGGGTSAVQNCLAKDPDGGMKLRETLIEAYSEYDRRHGTNLLTEVLHEMTFKQPKWAP